MFPQREQRWCISSGRRASHYHLSHPGRERSQTAKYASDGLVLTAKALNKQDLEASIKSRTVQQGYEKGFQPARKLHFQASWPLAGLQGKTGEIPDSPTFSWGFVAISSQVLVSRLYAWIWRDKEEPLLPPGSPSTTMMQLQALTHGATINNTSFSLSVKPKPANHSQWLSRYKITFKVYQLTKAFISRFAIWAPQLKKKKTAFKKTGPIKTHTLQFSKLFRNTYLILYVRRKEMQKMER